VKPLAIFGVLSTLGALGFTVRAIKTGRASFRSGVDYRDKNPIGFWFSIFTYLLLAGGFFFLAVIATLSSD
jgi:hypothetical protein